MSVASAAARGAAHASQINPGARLYAVCGNRARSVLAGSATAGIQDNTWHLGEVIDRTTPGLFLGGQGAVLVLPVLNTGESVTVEQRFRDSEDGTTDFQEIPSIPDADIGTITITAAQMVADPLARSLRVNLDLAGARKYIRQDIRINLSRANTDLCHTSGVVVLGSAPSAFLPAPESYDCSIVISGAIALMPAPDIWVVNATPSRPTRRHGSRPWRGITDGLWDGSCVWTCPYHERWCTGCVSTA